MADFTIRPAAPDDAAAVVALSATVHPYLVRGTANTRRTIAQPPPGEDWAAFVAEIGGDLVGWVAAYRKVRTAEPGFGQISLLQVHPAARRRGIGDALFEAAAGHLRAAGIRRVAATVQPEVLSFARRRGFEPTRELRYSVLDLTTFTPADHPPASLPEHRRRTGPTGEPEGHPDGDAGLRLVPLRETTAEALYAADVAAATDEPGDAPPQPPSPAAWRYDVWDNPDLDHDLSVAAVRGAEIVSFSLLVRDGARVWSDMTATAPAHRGRGLARRVKVEALRRAAAAGVTDAYTANDESNAPMLAVNTRLGYRPVATQYSCVADL
ncbi:phosphinothricin acetyltransferase [Actinoplanes ianthinogenes]|uniref:Phosphinothricin acetyltransferase n=1 Tax=Actinoplanes ianthinogenes TaxID=122358 RepID=A0ABM7LV97_9ACTN|nr:GNAT family N-acetyltransferase [Actinoplanes ianthinogenes]BCJ43193.1 phosphinothricin acetyltransferase [Actinoplanes ianthinogenes]GGQ89578.1 phosphinothricin acetyltransferase [Actinoplanes ianthinogenes]